VPVAGLEKAGRSCAKIASTSGPPGARDDPCHLRDFADHQFVTAAEDFQLMCRHGPAEEEALAVDAAAFEDEASLLLGLDPFRNGFESHRPGELEDGRNEPASMIVAG
jgi:hypothetical protein